MGYVCVMNNNYADSSFYNAFSYSSQATSMPASNVLNGVRRSKVWRSAGFWEITTANRGMVIREAIGVSQTVNIATGTYATDALFFAAVKTALESATSAATYTVTRDTTTNKIKITSNGSGGAILQLMTTEAGFTAADALGFSTAVNHTGALTYTAENLRLHSYEYLKFDLGSSFNPKAFILAGLRNTPIKISETATVTLEGNDTDVWTSPQYTSTITYNASMMAVISTTGLHTSALRYWRLKIIDQLNTSGYIEISNIYLGDLVKPTEGSVRFPLRTKFVDLSKLSYGRAGVTFADKIQMTKELTLDWEFLTVSEREDLEEMVSEVGVNTPFFVAIDPDAVFSSDFQREVYLVRFQSAPTFDLTSPGRFASTWQIREEL